MFSLAQALVSLSLEQRLLTLERSLHAGEPFMCADRSDRELLVALRREEYEDDATTAQRSRRLAHGSLFVSMPTGGEKIHMFPSDYVMRTVARGRGGGEEHLGLHCDAPTWGTGRLR